MCDISQNGWFQKISVPYCMWHQYFPHPDHQKFQNAQDIILLTPHPGPTPTPKSISFGISIISPTLRNSLFDIFLTSQQTRIYAFFTSINSPYKVHHQSHLILKGDSWAPHLEWNIMRCLNPSSCMYSSNLWLSNGGPLKTSFWKPWWLPFH